ncbi:MAG: MATE family efflux transporter [Desulfovibrio sp.]|jgi:putative MATE family efflux protein
MRPHPSRGHPPDLLTAPVPGLIRAIAIPASVGFFFQTMYNVVDTFFTGGISTQALAALSMSFPLYFIISAAASGLATGATALMGQALGRGEREHAQTLAVQGLSLAVLAGLVLAVLGHLLSEPAFAAMGARGEEMQTGLDYMLAIFKGAPLFLLVQLANAPLNASGNTRIYRNFLIFGFALNCVLDPWFIHGGLGLPAMGVRGVAWSTVLIQGIGVVYIALRSARFGLLQLTGWRCLAPRFRTIAAILGQGLPASANSVTIGLGVFVILYFVGQFGAEAKAAYGAAMRVEQLVLVPTIGLNIAALTLVAQNHGAGRLDRVRESMNTALRFGAWLMGAGTVLVYFLAPGLMWIFSDDPAVQQAGADYLRVDALVLYGYVVVFVCTATLQGMKRPMFALWLGLLRQIVLPGLLFSLLVFRLQLGLTSLWWGIFGIVWCSAGVAFVWARRVLAREERSAG